MLLKQPFLKLPIRFDADALAAEVRALPPSAWTPHPTGFVGNEAVRLITPHGEASDAIEGPMAATEHLQACDYVRQIMAELGGVWGRSRLMGLAAGREVPSHIDVNYYWRTHLRIHIPVITNPDVLFTCGGETVHMAAGDCWIFDSFRWHDVQNKGGEQRIHLVLDTVGGGLLPELMEAAGTAAAEPRMLLPGQRSGDGLVFERLNSPQVMSPWEMRCHLAFIGEHAASDPDTAAVLQRLDHFVAAWAAAWARFGAEEDGRSTYAQLLQDVRRDLAGLGAERLALRNELALLQVVDSLIFHVALSDPGLRPPPATAAAVGVADRELSQESVEELARTDLKGACNRARALVAARPDDEQAARLLRDVVERLARSSPPRPEDMAHLPPPLQEAARLLGAGQDEAAEITVRQYLAEHRNDVRAMAMMAEIAARCELFDNAHKILTRALEIDPRSVDVLLALGKLVNHISFVERSDRGTEALKIVERALDIEPGNIAAVSLHSSILVRFRRIAESVPSYDRLLELDPLHWLAWTNYGMLLGSIGRFGDAVAALRTAAAINPLYGQPWWELANLKIAKLFADDIAEMERIAAEPTLDAQSRAHIHFALAKAYHEARRFDAAAQQLDQGNAIKRTLEPHDPEEVAGDVDASERIFTPDFFAQREDAGDPRPDPIFIVGMQRAGTTLVEQILASHSAIEGTEELFLILNMAGKLAADAGGGPWQDSLERASPEALRTMGETFLELTTHFRLTDRPFFIDKNGTNWRYIGLIATILPNARIIDVRRNPMDCCFANYSQHYENMVGYSYSQTAVARYYADYVRLMRHVDRVLPGKVHRVIYEDLVDDLDAGVRGMLDYLGLPFEESCLRFHETDRVVLTPSAQQVRQPINRSGIGRWRDYGKWLKPLEEQLGDLVDTYRA